MALEPPNRYHERLQLRHELADTGHEVRRTRSRVLVTHGQAAETLDEVAQTLHVLEKMRPAERETPPHAVRTRHEQVRTLAEVRGT